MVNGTGISASCNPNMPLTVKVGGVLMIKLLVAEAIFPESAVTLQVAA